MTRPSLDRDGFLTNLDQTDRGPHWVDITALGSPCQVQLNIRADDNAPDNVAYRHREHTFPGELAREWRPGRPSPRPVTQSD